jgi:hypothetical protein
MGDMTEDDIRKLGAKGKVKKLVKIAESDDRVQATWAMDALLEARDPKTVPVILADVPRYMGRGGPVALAAARFADERHMPLYAEMMGSSDSSLQAAAKDALASSADGDPVLIESLRSGNPVLRRCAAEALGGQGSPESVDPVWAALAADDDDYVRMSCAEALATIGDERAAPAVEASLARDYAHADARKRVAAALATLKRDSAPPEIERGGTVKVVVRISGAMHGSTEFVNEYDVALPIDLNGPDLLNSLAMSIMRPGQSRYYTGYQLACPGGTLRSSADGETRKPVTLRDAGVKEGDALEFIDWGGSFI